MGEGQHSVSASLNHVAVAFGPCVRAEPGPLRRMPFFPHPEPVLLQSPLFGHAVRPCRAIPMNHDQPSEPQVKGRQLHLLPKERLSLVGP